MEIDDDPRPIEPVRLRVARASWVTGVLIGACVAAYGAQVLAAGSLLDVDAESALSAGANYGPAIAAGAWWRIVTSAFLHGGVLHLVLNMWGLRVLGPFVESVLGTGGFLVLYLTSAAFASLASVAVNPAQVSLGASGAIFALLGAHLAFFLRHRREMHAVLFRGQVRSVLLIIAINVGLGLSVPRVDNVAHVAGLASGLLGGVLLDRPLLEVPRMTARRWRGAALLAAACLPLAWAVRVRADPAYGLELPEPSSAWNQDQWRDMLRQAAEDVAAGQALDGHRLASYAHLELGEWERSLAEADAALQAAPGDGLSLELRAHALAALSRWSEALDAGRAAVAVGQGEAHVVAWLAAMHLRRREDAEVLRRDWRRQAATPPERALARFLGGEIDRAALEAVLAADLPEHAAAMAWSLEGERAYAAGDHATARQAWDAVLRAAEVEGRVTHLARARIAELDASPR